MEETASVIVESSPIAGAGLFIKHPVGMGARLVRYCGRLVKRSSLEGCTDVDFRTLALLDGDWLLDGGAPSNPGRFVNHSCEPNSELRRDGEQLWIFALRPLETGEEITIDYNLTAREALNWACRCGSHQCRGYAVGEPWKAEFFRELSRRSLRRRSRRSHEQD